MVDSQKLLQQGQAWRGFTTGHWSLRINVREFIHRNYTPYEGDFSFLATATPRTKMVWQAIIFFCKEAGRL